MLVTQNEEKRNTIWKIVVSVSSVLLVLVVLFFLIRLFSGNPLEGAWSRKSDDMRLLFQKKGTAVVCYSEATWKKPVEIEFRYELDKSKKIVSLYQNDAAIREAVDQCSGAVTEEELRSELNSLESAYDYNIEKNQLTLTEREYGNQMVFYKK